MQSLLSRAREDGNSGGGGEMSKSVVGGKFVATTCDVEERVARYQMLGEEILHILFGKIIANPLPEHRQRQTLLRQRDRRGPRGGAQVGWRE